MHFSISFVVLFFAPFYAISQVGIGTTTPNAQLEIKSTNQATPANTDGILIPKVDEFPVTAPTASQDGMMVYVTGSGTPSKGYYYWDNATTSWLSLFGDSNTLDQAYDEGGAGAGRTITATDGAVIIAGEDGFLVTGTIWSGDVAPSGTGSKMFFNPRKAAFRAGYVNGTQWDDASIGYSSAAMGENTTASGSLSTAMGVSTTASGYSSTAMGFGTTASESYSTAMGYGANASGQYSTAMGVNTIASGSSSIAIGRNTTASGVSSTTIGFFTTSPSAFETAIGSYNTAYTPIDTNTWNVADRLFVIGNGADAANKSNALTIYKNGLMNINDEYNMPLTDGATNQVLQTDGSGSLSWVDGSILGVEKINDLSDGKSDNDGTEDGSSIFLGINAGANDDSTDNQNVGIGFEALQVSTTGNKNNAIGYKALSSNTTGNSNTANGSWSLSSNTEGNFNTVSGYGSLLTNTTGDNNTVNGYRSLSLNITGSSNTATGFQSGYRSIGSRNIYLGYQSGFYESGSDKLYIESSNADANNALIYGEFDNNILRVNGELQLGNTAATRYAMPTADGTTNQVLQTDGAGSLSWVDGSTLGVEKINDLSDGKSDNDGTDNGSSIFLGINAGLNDDGTDNANVGIGFEALKANTTSIHNTATGYQSLYTNTIGSRNTAYGFWSLPANTTGGNNTANGNESLFKNTTGDNNTANGSTSLRFNTTGDNNTANGYQSLYSNGWGYSNTANGVSSLYSNTGGSLNTASGNESLYSNTNGIQNTSNGVSSLYSNTTGSQNTANGNESLYSNTTGYRNTAIGIVSLYSNTTGFKNIAIGNKSLYSNLTGSNNTAIGDSSGFNSTGFRNIFLGFKAGINETGSDKLYIESSNADANNALIYGEFNNNILRVNGELQLGNTAATRYAMPTADGTTNQVLQTDGAGNLTWVDPSALDDGDWVSVGADIERQSGDVFIGNDANTNNNLYISALLIDWDTPSYFINPGYENRVNEIQFDTGSESDPKVRFAETNSGFFSPGADITSYTANGTEAVRFEANGMVKILTAIDAEGTPGSGTLEIGGGLRLDNNEIITNTNSTLFIQHNNNGDLWIDNGTFMVDASTNRIGILNTTPATDLHLKQSDNLQAGGGGFTFESALANINWKIYHSGSAISFAENGVRRAYIASGTGAYVQPSDERLKRNFVIQNNYLSKLKNLNIYSYYYKNQENDKRSIGVKAQEIQSLFPELINKDEDGYLGMNYAGLSVVAIQAIKEQQIEIENQRKEIEELKKLVQQLIDKK
ncbi:MAG: tail fiber domain-containing protein [Flavobacteriaceae bacterium]|nr:tail fiber domain-containing protein [Flavobacteriaceae bacterium]